MPIVPINQIEIGSNRRPIRDDKVAELMESIKVNGLLNPITVDQNLTLIAGLHRLTACKLLGLKEIECNTVVYEDADQARLAEIDENFIRHELEPLERGKLSLEREEILERMGRRAKAGDNQYTRKGGESNSPPAKTTLELAKEAGYSERTLQHDKQIARDIIPKIQELIKGTPLAKNKTKLLQIARTGSKERTLAEQAQKFSEEALARGDEEEAAHQAKLAAQAKAMQEELQMQAFQSALASKESKPRKKVKPERQKEVLIVTTNQSVVKNGDEWFLDRHLVYCGDTSSQEFIQMLPSNAALAIATLSSTWNHDYLVDEAKIVAVIRSQGEIYEFCRRQRMPFQYELLIGNLYVGIFSRQSVAKPQTPINIEGVEGIVSYLLNLYTNQNNYVIAPFIGHGEILIASERMGCTCFIGDENPELVHQGIIRWQKWTGKQPKKAI
ncbi:ParB N-terminal domain-containing protein [Iningainema tapete]|uniref:ParB N-terminal domain-containing protein n=1 Tax=Iningainema tapete BLCC-T55 TaxID=2748662 RepID=A0A8J7BVX4_9CYAN|nr:ParB N-terminal domain-containing protein [Iningainema tapete]MBD2770732.1 ParB N-terminal domain-containing protein [Iningainema tapete BLCC-T55]